MATTEWLIDERREFTPAEEAELQKILSGPEGTRAARTPALLLAVRLRDLVVHDTKKWFGSAEIRVDAVVAHGGGNGAEASSYYMPSTYRFPGVRDGDPLLARDASLLIFHGKARHFIDITVLVSRNTKDSDDLADLLSRSLQGPELGKAAGTLLALTPLAPQAAAVTAAAGAAAVLGNFAYKALRNVTGNTIGLYRNAFLQLRDDFGLEPGRHPPDDSYRVQDFSFWYEVVDETARAAVPRP